MDCPKRLDRAAMSMAVLAALIVHARPAAAQQNQRPDDPLGLSIREPRVRVVHSDDPIQTDSSLSLQQTDPWLAYQRGRSYFHREWSSAQGLFKVLPDRAIASSATSCAMCHNRPFRSAGAGGNAPEPVGYGRNTPHLFGAGLIETLAIQIRRQILDAHDLNRNGILDVPSETRGRRVLVEAYPGVTVDFGALDDLDHDGLPDLNDVILPRMIDTRGRYKQTLSGGEPATLDAPGIVGYDPIVAPFSSTVGDHQFPTLRTFAVGALNSVMGLPVDDPTTASDHGRRRDRRAGDGWCETSLAGRHSLSCPLRYRITAAHPSQWERTDSVRARLTYLNGIC